MFDSKNKLDIAATLHSYFSVERFQFTVINDHDYINSLLLHNKFPPNFAA